MSTYLVIPPPPPPTLPPFIPDPRRPTPGGTPPPQDPSKSVKRHWEKFRNYWEFTGEPEPRQFSTRVVDGEKTYTQSFDKVVGNFRQSAYDAAVFGYETCVGFTWRNDRLAALANCTPPNPNDYGTFWTEPTLINYTVRWQYWGSTENSDHGALQRGEPFPTNPWTRNQPVKEHTESSRTWDDPDDCPYEGADYGPELKPSITGTLRTSKTAPEDDAQGNTQYYYHSLGTVAWEKAEYDGLPDEATATNLANSGKVYYAGKVPSPNATKEIRALFRWHEAYDYHMCSGYLSNGHYCE